MPRVYFYKRLGERIVTERRKMGLSQEDLSYSSDIDRTYLARIEEGKANPSIKVLKSLAYYLKKTVNELLEDV